jgi:GNAT superfamily N-acetyltransferase
VGINQLQLEPYQLRVLSVADLETIAEFETRASDYSLFMTGELPKAENARELFSQPDSQVFGVFLEQALIGILQVLSFEPNIEAIGLLLLEPAHRRAKLGTRVFEAYRTWALARGIQKLIVTVSLEDVVANAFWFSLGFELSDKTPVSTNFGGKIQVMQDLELVIA